MASDRFQNALQGIPQAVPPIWFMRQAGRYHAHYRALRAKHSFMKLCKQPELAAEVALGPIRDFDFDAAILFSDLLFPLEAMGMGLTYDPAPRLDWQLDASTLGRLRPVGEAAPELEFQRLAMRRTRALLADDKSLIGFVGGPWTLFAYAVEGAHKGGLEQSKKALNLFPKFCERLLPLLERNIELQLDGGAEAVMLLDTAAGELSPLVYLAIVPILLERLAQAFPKRLGYYAKGVGPAHLQHRVFETGTALAGIGLDHRWSLPDVFAGTYAHGRAPFGFVQGCFDQSLLFMEEAEFAVQAERYLASMLSCPLERRAGWIAGLGHGVLPGTPEANVRRLVQLTREVFTQ